MSKTIVFNEEAQRGLLKGIKKVADSVGCTLGPAGREVLIQNTYGAPTATKDGVTVAKAIELEDTLEDTGAKLIKDIASRTDDICGDGTTTSTILGASIVEEGLKSTSAGVNPILLKRGMDKAVIDTINHLKKLSKGIETKEQIAQVAAISANNDSEIGNLVADAMEAIGTNGIITTSESKSTETYTTFVEGMSFDRGFLSPYFCTDKDNLTAEFERPYILLTDKTISSTNAILNILEKVAKEGRSLLIIADNVEGEALSTLALNNIRGVISVCAIKSPGFGDRKKSILEDIAIVTGGTVISEDLGYRLEEAPLEMLGSCSSVKVSKDSTVIVGGNGDSSLIEARVSQIRKEIEESTSDYDKEKLQERLAKLAGGVAVINVGAVDELSLKEKKFRIEDSISATRCAIEAGILAGGGVALCQTSALLSKELSRDKKMSEEEKIGYNIVIKALEKPIRKIAENAGVDGSVVAEKCKKSKDGIGFNALTGKWVNMVESGIVDPTKVTTEALINAASVATLILTTSCAIVESKEKKLPPLNCSPSGCSGYDM